VRGLSRFAGGIFLSAGGVFILAALDSTVFFMFPFGIDAVVIILGVRHPDSRWLYPILATAGSLAGTAITFWMGRKIGEVGLEKYISKRRLNSAKAGVRKRGAITAVFGLVPPPFPFTAFVLASGALGVDAARFLGALGLVRLVRFGAETLVTAHYGTSVLRWLNSDVMQEIVVAVVAIAIVGSAIPVYALMRRSRRTARC
jgi:membrane protein YqaA with SNARE-associated domain